MTAQDLKTWLSSREEKDVWWIQIEGKTLGRKVNLAKIEQISDENLDSEVMVLHVSQATQRPRPWVEVERVKAAPVEKSLDNGLYGRHKNDAYSGEPEEHPAHKIDTAQSPTSRNPVSAPVPPQYSIDSPPLSTTHLITGKLNPHDKKVSLKCNRCGELGKHLFDKHPFRVRCRSCQSTHLIEKVEISLLQFYKVFLAHLSLLSLSALLSASLYNGSYEAERARRVAELFGKTINYFSSYFIGSLVAHMSIYFILTLALSLIFTQDLESYNLSRFDGFRYRLIKYGEWGCGIVWLLAIISWAIQIGLFAVLSGF